MQYIFISMKSIDRPVFFTRYYTNDGEHYQRLEQELNCNMFNGKPEVVRIELYRNSTENKILPMLVNTIWHDQCKL
jgi:hypothetical protein